MITTTRDQAASQLAIRVLVKTARGKRILHDLRRLVETGDLDGLSETECRAVLALLQATFDRTAPAVLDELNEALQA
jgi:hypothetical protein